MSENIYQVYTANPITSNTSTDLMYFGLSPYGATNDAAMTYANFAAQFASSALTTNYIYIGVGGVATASQTLPTAVQGNITQLGTQSQILNMGTNQISNVTDPTHPQDAATMNYVNNIAAGLNPVQGVYGASTANLTGFTYLNGVSGVGATLTAGSNGIFTEDGVSPPVGTRWLYKNDTTYTGTANGIYVITTSTAGSPAVLTRSTDYDTPSQIQVGDLVSVENGTVNALSAWYQTATVVTIGTSAISFSVFFNPASYANSGANSNITSMTGLTGYLEAPLGVKDSNGNIITSYLSTASAVNYFTLKNEATGGNPIFAVIGSDASISLDLEPKNGAVNILDSTETIGGEILLYNAAGTFYAGFRSATTSAASNVWTLPSADAAGLMQSNGSAVLSFTTQIAASVLPAGTVFNFHQGQLTTAFTTTSTSMTSITGLSIAITPTSASNKVLVRAVVQVGGNPAANQLFLQLFNSTASAAVGNATTAGSRTSCGASVSPQSVNVTQTVVMEFLDSPATTSATTYTVQIMNNVAGTASVNATSSDTNAATTPRCTSTISVCEIHG